MWYTGAARLADAERDHRVRVAVHDGHHVGARAVDLAVDEALEVGLAASSHGSLSAPCSWMSRGGHQLRGERSESRNRVGSSGCARSRGHRRRARRAWRGCGWPRPGRRGGGFAVGALRVAMVLRDDIFMRPVREPRHGRHDFPQPPQARERRRVLRMGGAHRARLRRPCRLRLPQGLHRRGRRAGHHRGVRRRGLAARLVHQVQHVEAKKKGARPLSEYKIQVCSSSAKAPSPPSLVLRPKSGQNRTKIPSRTRGATASMSSAR
jgi:hypothetical protein